MNDEIMTYIERLGLPVVLIIFACAALVKIWNWITPRIDKWKAEQQAVLDKTHAVMQKTAETGIEISRNNSSTLSIAVESIKELEKGQSSMLIMFGRMADKMDVMTNLMPTYTEEERNLIHNLRVEQRLSHMNLSKTARSYEPDRTVDAVTIEPNDPV